MTTNPPTLAGRRVTAAAGVLVLLGASLLAVGTTPATAAAALCGQFERAAVAGRAFVVQNNRWGTDATQCVSLGADGFTITTAEGSIDFGGAPKSYPSIFAGEHYGEGSNTASLPVKVSAIAGARTSARITPADGAWNAAWDIWVNSSPDSPGRNDDTEVMIWADSRGGPTPIGDKVDSISVEGRSYEVWKGSGAGGTDVVSYVDVVTTTTPDIPLAPFLQDSTSRGATEEGSWVTSVQFGFEPWKAGQGLAVDGFSFTTGQRPVRTTADPKPNDQQDDPELVDQAPDPAPHEEKPPSDAAGPDAGAPERQPSPGGSGQDGSGAPGSAVTSGSGRCMDVAAAATTDATVVQLYDCNTTSAQQWVVAGSTLVNPGSGKCLDVARAATAAGSRVQIWTCMPGAPGQRWARGQGQSVTNPASGLCLATTGAATANRSALVLATCDPAAPTQRWN